MILGRALLVSLLAHVVACSGIAPAPGSTAAPARPAVPVAAVASRGEQTPSAPSIQPPFPALAAYAETEPLFIMLDDFHVALDSSEVGLVVVKESQSCIRFLRFRASDLSMISKSGCFEMSGPNVLGLVRTRTRWLALVRDRGDNASTGTAGYVRVVAFDDFGTRLSSVLRLGISVYPNVPAARIVSRPGGALLLFAEGDSMQALILDDEGRAGTRFDLGPGGHGPLASTWVDGGFLVVRRRDPEDNYGKAVPSDAPLFVTYVSVEGGPLRTTQHSLGADLSSLNLVDLMGAPALVYRRSYRDAWLLPLGSRGEAVGAAVELATHPLNGLFGPVTSLGELALFHQKDDGPAGPSPITYGLVDRSGRIVASRVPIVAQRSSAQRAAVASFGRDAIIAWRGGDQADRVGLARFHARPTAPLVRLTLYPLDACRGRGRS